jgi:hypothetical protein
MTPKKLKTTAVNKSDYIIYLKKANDFYVITKKASDLELWAAVGLNAVHCAISCCDALLVFYLGIRSVSDNHMDVVDLLLRLPKKKAQDEVATLKRILAKKNIIAYENREFRQQEALEILKLSDRFYVWVLSNLPR